MMHTPVSRGKLSRYLAATALCTVLAVACKKSVQLPGPIPGNPTQPELTYFDLANQEIPWGGPAVFIDLTGDRYPEIIFSRRLVGDPIHREDKWQWLAGTTYFTSLPINVLEQVPSLSAGQTIPLNDFGAYAWFNSIETLLMQRVEHADGAVRWEGSWKNLQRRYLPLQTVIDNRRFNGWVELTVDAQAGKVILHRAAISRYPERNIRAGA